MTSEPPRCAWCNHFRGSHIGANGACIVEYISGPPSGSDAAPSTGDPHPGRIIKVCECKRFV